MNCSKVMLLKVLLIKYFKDDALISVKIVNFVKIISLKKCLKMMLFICVVVNVIQG